LFAIGVELPSRYLARHAKGLSVMVIPTMAFGWVVVAGKWPYNEFHTRFFIEYTLGILKALIPNLSYVSCLAISACLTPTDPIICAVIVGMCYRTIPSSFSHGFRRQIRNQTRTIKPEACSLC
jgi:sodium/hydrogen antiporter